jgi:hypothetical protein
MTPPIVSIRKADPQAIEIACGILARSHTIEHRAISHIRSGNTTEAKMELQRQIAALVSVLAML